MAYEMSQAVTTESFLFIMLLLFNYIFIMNSGRKISPLRRFLGGGLMWAIGTLGLIVMGSNNTNETMNVIGWTYFIVTLMYFLLQVQAGIQSWHKDS